MAVIFIMINNTSHMHTSCDKQNTARYQKNVEKIFTSILDELRIDMNQIAYDIVNNKADPNNRLHDLVSDKYAWIKWITLPTRHNDAQIRHFLTEKMHIGKAVTNNNTYEWIIPVEIMTSGTCHSGKIIFGIMTRHLKEKIDSYLLDQEMSFIVLDEYKDPIFLYNDDRRDEALSNLSNQNNELLRFHDYPLLLYSSHHCHIGHYLYFSIEFWLIIAMITLSHFVVYWTINGTLKTLSSPLETKMTPIYTYIYEVDLILKRIRYLTQQNIHNKVTIQNLSILNEESKVAQDLIETTCKRIRHLLEEAIADRDACMIVNKTMEDRLIHANSITQKNMEEHRHTVHFINNILREAIKDIENNINYIRGINIAKNITNESHEVMRALEYRNTANKAFILNAITLLKINIGSFQVNAEKVNISSFINDCIEMLIYPANHYNVQISHNIADNICDVRLDKCHIQISLTGFLDSLIKSRKSTSIEVLVRDDLNYIVIQITCDGIAIEMKQDLFHAHSINKIETFLYIMNKIIYLHNGKLTCNANAKMGQSIITIQIPKQ